MGLFSKVPKLRKWIDEFYPLALKGLNENDPKSLTLMFSVAILKTIGSIFEPKPVSDNNMKFFEESLKEYDTDECLFEVLCYILFRIDVWLFTGDYTEFREKVFYPKIVEYCISSFSKTVKGEDLNSVFDNRMEVYGRLIRDKADMQKEQHYLTQYLYNASSQKKAQRYDPGNAPIIITGISYTVMIGIRITSHVQAYFKTYTEGIAQIVNKMVELGELIDACIRTRHNLKLGA